VPRYPAGIIGNRQKGSVFRSRVELNSRTVVYDKETTEELIEAIRQDLGLGEIDIAEIETALAAGSPAPGN
jgi:hypothetical protein